MSEEEEERICRNVFCGKVLTQRENESNWDFKTKKYCNHKCQAESAVPKKTKKGRGIVINKKDLSRYKGEE